MDYLEIMLKGYFDDTEKANLSDYLLEQFHKVESQTMTAKRFFDGCFNAIETLNKDIETRLLKRKEQLKYGAENSEKNKDYFIDELKTISRKNFASTLPHGGQLWAKDIDFIKETIQAAKVKVTAPKEIDEPKEKTTIGSIGNEINFIRDYWKKTKHESESLIRYYKQIDQPTHIKDIQTKKLIPFDNYFGGYSDRLNQPFIFWNGFYIQPFKVQYLNELINDQKLFYNGKIVTEINEIKDYIFAYKKGFETGYKHFDNIEIKNKSSVFKSDNLSIEKINNFVEYKKNIAKTGFTFTFFFKGKIREYCPYRNNYKETIGLPSCECFLMPEYPKGGEAPCFYCPLYTLPELRKWEQKGFENGKYYRAWFVILSNFKIFDEYFKNIQTPTPTGQPQQESSNTELKQSEKLKKIWLANPKISVDVFLQKGIEKGIWDENYKIITQRGSLYGTGKTLLGSLSIALKGWAINENIDYKIVGTCFCDAFNIEQKESTKDPYKAFSTGNPKIIKEFKRAYKIN